MSTIPHKLHLYYHQDVSNGHTEYGAFLDKQLDGTWPRCTHKETINRAQHRCNDYQHPDFEGWCPTHGLADANDALKAVEQDKNADTEELADATNFLLYAEKVVLYGAATKEQEPAAWDAMMVARERAIKY